MKGKINIEQKPKIGPVGEAIIASIAVVGVVSIFALFPGVTCVIAPFIKKKNYPRKQTIQNSIESLLQAGLVKKYIRTGQSHYSLLKKESGRHYCEQNLLMREKKNGICSGELLFLTCHRQKVN